MNRQSVARTNQSSKSDTPLVSGILQRAAVRSISETEMQPQEDTENSTWQESRFHHDFSRVPAYSTTPIVQPKLIIGAVGDKYEQEADRVAHQVVSQIHAPGNQTVQREEMSDKDDEESDLMVQRQSDGGGMAATPELEASIQQARGSGQPLSENIRKPMEQAFGADFSRVKVHADAQSEQMNRSIQAKAFTTGQDIFFRQGVYSPGSRGGQELIAHELTHVVQQREGHVKPQIEQEADITPASFEESDVIQREIALDFKPYQYDNKLAEELATHQRFEYIGFTDPLVNNHSVTDKYKFASNFNRPTFEKTEVQEEHKDEILLGERTVQARIVSVPLNTFSFLIHLPTRPPWEVDNVPRDNVVSILKKLRLNLPETTRLNDRIKFQVKGEPRDDLFLMHAENHEREHGRSIIRYVFNEIMDLDKTLQQLQSLEAISQGPAWEIEDIFYEQYLPPSLNERLYEIFDALEQEQKDFHSTPKGSLPRLTVKVESPSSVILWMEPVAW
ncbi:MAG: hypothetical protein Fur006_20910 [Coleofasciculaceae cyanobacterium]